MANGLNSPSSRPLIVFFGSGPVAAASLSFLYNHATIELVVTKNKPVHHKDPAPVETFAKDKGLNIVYADTKDELDTILSHQTLKSLCGVVIDYGVIISKMLIDTFPRGIINSHFSLLPEWRGADPITFSLLSGQAKTGVCLMAINEGLDTGPLIASAEVLIEPQDTNTSLTTKFINTSNKLLQNTLSDYIAGKVDPKNQSDTVVRTYSRKLTKQDGWLDLSKPATVLEREIRSFNEWPKSKLVLSDSVSAVIIKAAATSKQIPQGQLSIGKDSLVIGTRVGSLEILELAPLGKQAMSIDAFLNGYRQRLI